MVLKSMYKYLIAVIFSSVIISGILIYNVSTTPKVTHEAKVIIKEPAPYITGML